MNPDPRFFVAICRPTPPKEHRVPPRIRRPLSAASAAAANNCFPGPDPQTNPCAPKKGRHVFEVKGVNSTRFVDPTPAPALKKETQAKTTSRRAAQLMPRPALPRL
jgi:hypothetical protein